MGHRPNPYKIGVRDRRGSPIDSFLLSSGSAPPVNFVITGVSQNAGTIDGGTVIHVTGTGFCLVGMSTGLGTISNVTSNSCDITTNPAAGGIPGPFAWTLNCPGGGVATPAQSYDYLAHPTLSAIAPNNGAATLTNTGRSFTGTGFPPSGSVGVPITGTVGAGVLANVAYVNGTSFTADFSAPGAGTLNAAISVDGVAAAGGAGIYTGNPVPTITSSQAVGTSGGPSATSGTGFIAGLTASISLAGGTALTVSNVTSTSATLTLPAGTYAPGNYDLTITNPDGQVATGGTGIFVITSIQTPAVILGADLWADWDPDFATSGTTFTLPDQGSGHAQNATATGTARPTLIVADPDANGHNSVQFDGVANVLSVPSFQMGAGNTLYWYFAFKQLGSTGGNQFMIAYGTSDQALEYIDASGDPSFFISGGNATIATSIANTKAMLFGGDIGSAGTTNNVEISLNNGAPATAVHTSTIPASGGTMTIGARAGAGFGKYKLMRAGASSRQFSSGDKLALAKFLNFTYQLTPPPSLTSTTNVLATTGTGFRVAGSGFQTGITATIDLSPAGGSSTQALTVDGSGTNWIQLSGLPSTPVGSYDLTLTNADGGQNTFAGAVHVVASATTDPMTACGLKVSSWTQASALNAAGNPPANGDAIKQWNDLSLRTNAPVQATGASQPTWKTNATPNGSPAIVGNGSSQFLADTLGLPAAPACYAYFVIKQNVNTGTQIAFNLSGIDAVLEYVTGNPRVATFTGGTRTASWGSSPTGYQIIRVRIDAGATPTIGIRVGNGTEVTIASLSATAVASSQGESLWERAAIAFFNGEIAARVILSSAPTPTEDANLMTVLGAV